MHHFCLTVEKLEPAGRGADGRRRQALRLDQDRDRASALLPSEKPVIGNGLDGNRQSWLQDPDGNRIELMEMAPDCLQYKAIRRLQSARSV